MPVERTAVTNWPSKRGSRAEITRYCSSNSTLRVSQCPATPPSGKQTRLGGRPWTLPTRAQLRPSPGPRWVPSSAFPGCAVGVDRVATAEQGWEDDTRRTHDEIRLHPDDRAERTEGAGELRGRGRAARLRLRGVERS